MAMIVGEPRWSRLLSFLVLLFGGSISIALVYTSTIQEPSALKWSSWAFHDWLVNFEGGFVRRGLAGHIIRQNIGVSEIEVVNFVVFAQFLLFVVISIIFALVFIVGLKSTAFFVACPLSFLGMAVGNHYYFRKEIIFYIGIFLVAVLMAFLQRHNSKLLRAAIFAIIGVWTVIGPFLHEGFFFFCVPIFGLMLAELVGDRFRSVVVSSYIVLSVFMFGVLANFAGNESIAGQIWLSLSDEVRSLAPSASPTGGISAIGWSTRDAVALTVKAVLRGMIAYYLLSLVIVYLVVGLIVSAQRGLSIVVVVTSAQFIAGFALILLTFAPLFILGWDWGRWICGVYVVALAFFSLRLDNAIVDWVMPWFMLAARPAFLTFAAFVFLLVIKVPECCISGRGLSFGDYPAMWSVLANFMRYVFH